MQRLGFLPAIAVIDAVYGAATRKAINEWQLSAGRPATGLLSDADAALLLDNTNASLPSASAATGSAALAPVRDSVAGQAPQLGPSFSCPQPNDQLANLICSNPALARADLLFVQAYEALRQQDGPSREGDLRQEAIDFTLAVRNGCGLAAPGTRSPLAPAASAAPCTQQFYQRQRDALLSRLSGEALEEATRPLKRHAALQADLQRLGNLPRDAAIDAVYGTQTRAAIIAWQQAAGRRASGLLSDADATILERTAANPSPPVTAAADVNIPSAGLANARPESLPPPGGPAADTQARALSSDSAPKTPPSASGIGGAAPAAGTPDANAGSSRNSASIPPLVVAAPHVSVGQAPGYSSGLPPIIPPPTNTDGIGAAPTGTAERTGVSSPTSAASAALVPGAPQAPGPQALSVAGMSAAHSARSNAGPSSLWLAPAPLPFIVYHWIRRRRRGPRGWMRNSSAGIRFRDTAQEPEFGGAERLSEHISGLNDPLTGQPLHLRSALHECGNCGAFYQAESLPSIREHGGQCIVCREYSISPTPAATDAPRRWRAMASNS